MRFVGANRSWVAHGLSISGLVQHSFCKSGMGLISARSDRFDQAHAGGQFAKVGLEVFMEVS